MREPIYVTKPSLAPVSEFVPYLERIWASGVMTHNGPLMRQLEQEVAAYEKVSDSVCVANGTCALQLAIRALDLEGEIITTPFTFIATANIIDWERCTPVFVDIDPATWNLDPTLIEEAITDRTVGIMPVHVFSAPCDVHAIQEVADKYGLKVIYDSAHAMCVKVGEQSIHTFGDVSCTSFHATKLFNTSEGGACFSSNHALLERIRRMRFFGFNEAKEIADKGMNAKMTEVSAGLGLANLSHLDEVRRLRKLKYHLYEKLLQVNASVTFQAYAEDEYNFSYMPILLGSEAEVLDTVNRLQAEKVYPRRYFHPSLHTVDLFDSKSLPVSFDIASRILCMPLYSDLSDEDIEFICSAINAG